MNQTSPEIDALLSQLKDITPPDPINWWPPAIGWWLVLGLSAAFAVLAFYLIKKFRQRRRWNRAIADEIAMIAQSSDPSIIVCNANKLLKRLVRLKFPEAKTTALHGKLWTNFLEEKYGEHAEKINLTPLAEAGYQSSPEFDTSTLLNDLRTWIKRCC